MADRHVIDEANPICADGTATWPAREPMRLVKIEGRTWEPTSLVVVFDEGSQFCHRKFVSSRHEGRKILRRHDGKKITRAELDADGWEYLR